MVSKANRSGNSIFHSSFRIYHSAFLLALGLAAWPVIFGGFNWALLSFGPLGPGWQVIFFLICVSIAIIPPVAGLVDRLLQRLKEPSPRATLVSSIAVACIASAYLWITAAAGHRHFFPYLHDEFSYLIQAHQFASGHLWMPAHPLARFFDSFQLLVKPVYASAYFPGTALLHVPGIWLHLPPYVTSLVISGITAGLLFWITRQLIDGVAAGMAVLLLLSDSEYREVSILTLAQMPLLLYGLIAIATWLKWRGQDRFGNRWLVITGLFLGLAGVTRPVDALCFAIPIGIAVLFRKPGRLWLLILGAMPLVILQLILNHGITGHWLRTPFGLYTDRDYPGANYGFHTYNPALKPESDLPQKQALYREYQPLLIGHRPGNILDDLLHAHGPFNGARLRVALSQSSPQPFPLLLPLLPLALLAMTSDRCLVLLSLPLFLLLYIPYMFFFPHYVTSVAPAVIVGIVLGAKVLRNSFKARRRLVEVMLMLFIAGNALAALPQWAPWKEDLFQTELLESVNRQLAALPRKPAVVLFKYHPRPSTHEEPVYNADVAWPDDAVVIRAHDRSAENHFIFDYFASHQPSRFFYRFDESNQSLEPLGTAADLSRRH